MYSHILAFDKLSFFLPWTLNVRLLRLDTIQGLLGTVRRVRIDRTVIRGNDAFLMMMACLECSSSERFWLAVI